MNWFFIALVGPAIWSVCNHIDKYLISKYLKNSGIGSLIIFSSLIGLVIAPLIFITHPNVFEISLFYAVILIFNGCLYVISLLPYMLALKEDDASVVVPLFQTIPIFGYILGSLFLNESLPFLKIFAGIIIIGGAVIISLDIESKAIKLKRRVFWLMMLSSFLVAINFFLFKFVAISNNFWTTSFWGYVGFSILAILIFGLSKSYRNDFLKVVKVNKKTVLGLNIFNECLNIIGKLCVDFALLLAPLAMVLVVNAFQPAFVFVYGILLSIFFPKLSQESLKPKHLIQKSFAIGIMIVGVFLLNR